MSSATQGIKESVQRPAAPIINSQTACTQDLTQQLNITERRAPDIAASTQPDLLQPTNETEKEPFDSITKINDGEWYNNRKIDLKWLLHSNKCLSVSRKAKNGRLRFVITCHVCAAHQNEVKTFSSNGQVPLANGVRADGRDRFMKVIEHLDSTVHCEAESLQVHAESRASMANSHQFARVFNKVTLETKKFLVRLAIDVYNDSLVETFSARS